MNAKIFTIAISVSGLSAWNVLAGPPVLVVQPPALPTVVVSAPATVVTVQSPPAVMLGTVPDSYVWDGDEYVGLVGNNYYYLGPNHDWLRLDAPRLGRFHDWEKVHTDWRSHAIHNEHYRYDAHGNDAPHPDQGHDGDHHDRDHNN